MPLFTSTPRVAESGGAYLIGKRALAKKRSNHCLPMVFTGTAILYFGWFGFNAGSASAANKIAALAFVNTVVAGGCNSHGCLVSGAVRGKPSLLGACSGAVAGLWDHLPPACGYVGVGGALSLWSG